MKLTSAENDPSGDHQTTLATNGKSTKMADADVTSPTDSETTQVKNGAKNGSNNGLDSKTESATNGIKNEVDNDVDMTDEIREENKEDSNGEHDATVKENGDGADVTEEAMDTTETNTDNLVTVKTEVTPESDDSAAQGKDTPTSAVNENEADVKEEIKSEENETKDKSENETESCATSDVKEEIADDKTSESKTEESLTEDKSDDVTKVASDDEEESSTITTTITKPGGKGKVVVESSDSQSSDKSGKSEASDDVVLVSSGDTTGKKGKTDDNDLEKLKAAGGLKMQLDDGETFEVQMISSGESEEEEEDDDVVEAKVTATSTSKTTPTVSYVKTAAQSAPSTVTRITIPATTVTLRPAHKPSILAHSQVYRDARGNLIRKPVPAVKSNSTTTLQPVITVQQAPPAKPQGPTNEELAIEFNKNSRKKLTINNLIDALKDFGIDLEFLKEMDGEKKDEKSDEKKKADEKESDSKSEKNEKEDAKTDKENDTDSDKKDPESKSEKDEKESDESEKKGKEDEKEDSEAEKEESKTDEVPSSPARRSSRRISKPNDKSADDTKTKNKAKPTEKTTEKAADKTTEKSVEKAADEKSAEKKAVEEASEEKVKEDAKKSDTKTEKDDKKSDAKKEDKNDKKEEVIIDSDDENKMKKKAAEEDADSDIASHGDVAKKLRPVAKFLYFTGLDFSREVVYHDLVTAGDKKHKQGKLHGHEIHDLQQMRKLYYKLHSKNKKLRPKHGRICKRCPFSSESKSAMYLHRQQGHLDEKSVTWSCTLCDFNSKLIQAFVYHMEAEHCIKATPLPKPQFFSCSLCSYNSSTKSHLTKHMAKCEKTFVAEKHQFPLYDDINFIFRALPGPLIKVPQPPPQPQPVRPQFRPTVPNQQQRFVLQPSTALPILPRGVQYKPLPTMRPAPAAVAPGRNRYPPQTAQQFITNTIQQMKIIPQTQPIVIKDNSPVSSTSATRVVSSTQGVKRPPTVASLATTGAPRAKAGKYSYEVCEICGGFVLDRQALRLHFAMAHNINLREDALDVNRSPPLACDFCTSRFFTFQGLSLHKARSNHARADQALCHICNTLTSDMPSHIKSAHNIVPNQLNTIRICPICGQCVLTEKTEVHIERVHNIKLEKPVTMTAKPVYSCHQCSAQFTERSLLNLHIRKGHPAPSNKKCTICGALTQASGFTRHVLVAHCRKKLKVKLSRCDADVKKVVEKTEEVVVLDTPEKIRTPQKARRTGPKAEKADLVEVDDDDDDDDVESVKSRATPDTTA